MRERFAIVGRSCVTFRETAREELCFPSRDAGWVGVVDRALPLYSHPQSRAQNVESVGSNVAAARHASWRQQCGSDHRRPNQSPRAICLVTRATSATCARRPRLCPALPAPAPLLAAAVKARPCSARRYTTNFENYMRPENLHERHPRSSADLRTQIECS